MTRRNAALLALVGTSLATIVLVIGFIGDVLGVVQNVIPAARLLMSSIYAFAALSMAVFLYVSYRERP
jgi:hypothetical protein